jgi:hypothetical protein
MNVLSNAALAAALLAGAGAGKAVAATVDINFGSFAKSDLSAALDQRDAFLGAGRTLAEDFEFGFTPCDGSNHVNCSAGTIRSISLGDFSGYGEAGKKGASQVQPRRKIVVRTGPPGAYGRYNVTPLGQNWLDSNDREGIDWTYSASGDDTFRRLAFLLTDLDDVGAILFNISVNGASAWARPGSQHGENGQVHLVTLLFGQPVSSFAIRMVNGTGDGFGLDGARVALVPLPAAGVLLLGTLGGLIALARRRRAR